MANTLRTGIEWSLNLAALPPHRLTTPLMKVCSLVQTLSECTQGGQEIEAQSSYPTAAFPETDQDEESTSSHGIKTERLPGRYLPRDFWSQEF